MRQVPKLQVALLTGSSKHNSYWKSVLYAKTLKGQRRKEDTGTARSRLSLITYHLSLLSLPGGDEDGGTVVRDTYGQTGVRTEVGQSLDTGKIKTQT